MPLLFGLHILVALACAVHVVRTRQEMYWIMILLIFPGIGSLIYVVAVMLPSMAGSQTARKAGAAARKALDPAREAREALTQVEISRTPGSLKRAADALIATHKPDLALPLIQEAASGAYGDDPAMLHTLARAQYETGAPRDALATLEYMQAEHPALRQAEAHLLYARALEAVGQTEDALLTYAAVSDYYPGPEARARWAMLLEGEDRRDEARSRWQEILAGARHAPKFVQRTHRKWLDMARARA